MSRWKLSTCFVLVALLGYTAGSVGGRTANASTYDRLAVFAEVLSLIQSRYVENIDDTALIDAAIDGMLGELDPHSVYLDPTSYAAMQSDTRGEYVGVGIMIRATDAGVVIDEVFEGGPARDAGVLPGDVIVSINDESATDFETSDVASRLRGPRGEIVDLGLRRTTDAESSDLVISIVRDVIHMEAVAAEMPVPGYGVVTVSSFQSNVSDDVRAAIDRLRGESETALHGLVLDLRGNPGGLLSEAIHMSDIFLSEGTIVSTRGRGDAEQSEWTASRSNTTYRGPLVVLVDGGTASASEIVAGALQDHGRALVLGTQSYGKGSVQSIIDLSGGAGLKLTVSLYFTPSGRSIQGDGIHPDQIVEAGEATPELAHEGGEAALAGALANPSPIARPGFDLSAVQDRQLRVALEQLRAVEVLAVER